MSSMFVLVHNHMTVDVRGGCIESSTSKTPVITEQSFGVFSGGSTQSKVSVPSLLSETKTSLCWFVFVAFSCILVSKHFLHRPVFVHRSLFWFKILPPVKKI